MANKDYERASVGAAVGNLELFWVDNTIKHLESRLAELMEQRREIINRHNLNKCDCDFTVNDGRKKCLYCGAKV